MRQTINRIIQIENEIKRRKSGKLSNYNNGKIIHTKQIAFHRCTKRNRWVFGGNRSGKTECGAVEAIWMCRGIHPYRSNRPSVNGWVVSLSSTVLRDVSQAKILSYLPKEWIEEVVMQSGRKGSCEYGIIDYIVIRNISGKLSKLTFKSCEAGREKFQGTSLDFVWFDEEPPQDIYEECQMRVLDTVGDIFGTMTPLKGQTWVFDRIYCNIHSDEQVWSITMEWADNPYLSSNEIKALSTTLSESSLLSRRYGQFATNSGQVYSEFDVNVHVIEPFDVPFNWQDNISIDTGLNNPTSVHWYCVDNDGVVYVIAEHYMAGKDVTYHANRIKEISKSLNWHTDRYGKLSCLIDSAATQRTLASSVSVCELFIEQGINVNSKVIKDMFSGINRVKGYLKPLEGNPKLYIFKNCVNLIREFKGYYWGNEDLPVKRDDHALDELRYYIQTRPEANIERQVKSQIELDKEKLSRKLRINDKFSTGSF